LRLQLAKVTDVVGEHSVIVGDLGTLTKAHNDGKASAWGWILAETRSVLHMDRIDDGLVDELDSWIGIKVGGQTPGDGQQGEGVDQDLEQTELQAAVGDVRIGALPPVDNLK